MMDSYVPIIVTLWSGKEIWDVEIRRVSLPLKIVWSGILVFSIRTERADVTWRIVH